jgi:hypothetical protein
MLEATVYLCVVNMPCNGGSMRFLVRITIPVETGNAKVKDGSLGPTLQTILQLQNPEAVYFLDIDGMRTVYLIVNIANASDITAIVEPWFLAFSARVELRTVLTMDDLSKGGPGLADIVAKFGS